MPWAVNSAAIRRRQTALPHPAEDRLELLRELLGLPSVGRRASRAGHPRPGPPFQPPSFTPSALAAARALGAHAPFLLRDHRHDADRLAVGGGHIDRDEIDARL